MTKKELQQVEDIAKKIIEEVCHDKKRIKIIGIINGKSC